MHHLHLLFRKFSGESLGPLFRRKFHSRNPTAVGLYYCLYSTEIGLYDPVPSGSGFSFSIHQWHCVFLAQFNKRYSLVWMSLKGLICSPDCTALLHCFKIFSGEAPEPPPTGGETPPVPSPTRPFRPRENPQASFWIRHWDFACRFFF